MADLRYISKNYRIDILIDKNDIDSTDVVLLYDNNDPSNPTLLTTINSVETDDDPSFGDSYLFSYTAVANKPGVFSFFYTTRDLSNNEGSIASSLSQEICLTPQAPSVLLFDDLIFGGNTSGDFSSEEEFQTVFHYEISNISNIEIDGDYAIDDTDIGVDTPSDGDYIYYRTYTNTTCSTESADSDDLAIVIDTSVPSQVPLADATNVFLDNSIDGSFLLRWNYNDPTGDPIDSFNIYVDSDGDPSADNFTLDGTANFHTITNQFTYTTTTNPDGLFVYYKIVPVSGVNERDNDVIISGIADANPPVVVNQEMTLTIL